LFDVSKNNPVSPSVADGRIWLVIKLYRNWKCGVIQINSRAGWELTKEKSGVGSLYKPAATTKAFSAIKSSNLAFIRESGRVRVVFASTKNKTNKGNENKQRFHSQHFLKTQTPKQYE